MGRSKEGREDLELVCEEKGGIEGRKGRVNAEEEGKEVWKVGGEGVEERRVEGEEGGWSTRLCRVGIQGSLPALCVMTNISVIA